MSSSAASPVGLDPLRSPSTGAPGGGTLDAPIQPPTPVCERGSLHFKAFAAPCP